jgi:hypothetical protein
MKRRPSHCEPSYFGIEPRTINQIIKHPDDIKSLRVTSVNGGTLSTATFVAIKEIAQKKQAIPRAALADAGTFPDF